MLWIFIELEFISLSSRNTFNRAIFQNANDNNISSWKLDMAEYNCLSFLRKVFMNSFYALQTY